MSTNKSTSDDDYDTEVILARIEGHVKSIRVMLMFFTVLALIGLVVGILSAVVNS